MVRMRGCLAFACITVPNAQYLRHCVPAIVDSSDAQSVALEFPTDKADLPARIDRYYSDINQGYFSLS